MRRIQLKSVADPGFGHWGGGGLKFFCRELTRPHSGIVQAK